MSPSVGELLVNIIQPMLGAGVPQVVKTTGAEDFAELVQDGMADDLHPWTEQGLRWSGGPQKCARFIPVS